ncbi:hypothetical protein SteCoe_20999 [Stentor coeruleus]|uniref:Mini-chromosome maintenance complex-binding protein n=1 Tax=Stentor coeruleus TaxID=5963 RepID=A0A1R2BQN6_9CILI|nr:hypothetical protein SteCoe_20999 [Stentor coeruleus]
MEVYRQVSESLARFIEEKKITLPLNQTTVKELQEWKPILNLNTEIEEWNSGCKGLCRLRGMIQDQEEPELSIGFYTENGRLESCLYGNYMENAQFVDGIFVQRYPVVCVPVPGEGLEVEMPRVVFYNEMGEHLVVTSVVDLIGIALNGEFHVVDIARNRQFQADCTWRESVLRGLEMCIGDSLAAELLLYNLLSKIQERSSLIGNLCLNFTNVSSKSETIIKSLKTLTRAVCIQLTLDFLNTQDLTPRKNLETERLSQSPLQIPNNTLLILDETKLSQGTLTPKGLENVNVLLQLVQSQSLSYDFGYSKINFPTDLKIIVLSQGRSFLKIPTSCSLLSPINEYIFTDEDRSYVSFYADFAVSLPDELTKTAQEYFVSKRKDNKITVEDLHQLLLLTRYTAQSHGILQAQPSHWSHAISLSTQLIERAKV